MSLCSWQNSRHINRGPLTSKTFILYRRINQLPPSKKWAKNEGSMQNANATEAINKPGIYVERRLNKLCRYLRWTKTRNGKNFAKRTLRQMTVLIIQKTLKRFYLGVSRKVFCVVAVLVECTLFDWDKWLLMWPAAAKDRAQAQED